MSFGGWSRAEPSGQWRRGMIAAGAFQSLAFGATLLFMNTQFTPAFDTMFAIAPQWVWAVLLLSIGTVETVYVLWDRLRFFFVPALIAKMGFFLMFAATLLFEELQNSHASPWGPINYLTFTVLVALALVYGGDRHRQ